MLHLSTLIIAGLLVGMTAIPVHALQHSDSVSMQTSVNLKTTASECNNSPGPIVTLEGLIATSDIQAELLFRNNNNPVDGPHEHSEDVTASVTLETGDAIAVPKQPSRGGTGGNPFIWMQLTDGNGNELTEEIFLGRCVQGLDDVSASLMMPTTVDLDFSAECSNTTNVVTLEGGQITLDGLNAKIIFRNNDNPVDGPHEFTETSTTDVTLIPLGETIVIPKQPVLGGVGGNPFINIQFLDAQGNAISDETFLGRCVQDF